MHYQLTFDDERNDLEYRINNIKNNRTPISILLDRIEDVKNIGAIFRLADAARLKHIYLYDCNFELNHRKIKSVSRSAIKYVECSILESFESVQHLVSDKILITLERTSNSISYNNIKLPKKAEPQKELILAAGAENYGVSDKLIEISDMITHIPMFGINTSMNVASAVSIVTYHLLMSVIKNEI